MTKKLIDALIPLASLVVFVALLLVIVYLASDTPVRQIVVHFGSMFYGHPFVIAFTASMGLLGFALMLVRIVEGYESGQRRSILMFEDRWTTSGLLQVLGTAFVKLSDPRCVPSRKADLAVVGLGMRKLAQTGRMGAEARALVDSLGLNQGSQEADLAQAVQVIVFDLRVEPKGQPDNVRRAADV